MRIGEVAGRTGVPPKTIRFWEDQRLLPPPARTPAGYRDYDPAVLERLAFIRHAQAAGPRTLPVTPGHADMAVPKNRAVWRRASSVASSRLITKVPGWPAVQRCPVAGLAKCST